MIHQMNKVLVSILKQEWPHNWPSFIGDICGASKNSEILCENNMHILRLLSEEVFDFSKDSMTTVCMRRPHAVASMASTRLACRGRAPRGASRGASAPPRPSSYAASRAARAVATSTDHAGQDPHPERILNTEFAEIFKLCILCWGLPHDLNYQRHTQNAQAFLSWIPLGYLFETDLIRTLISASSPRPIPKCRIRVPHGNRVARRPRAEVRPENHPAVRRRAAGVGAGRAAERVVGFRF